MSAHQAVFPVAVMARVLGVSEAGFHAWRRRPASAHALSDAALLKRIRTIHAGSRETYGAPRVHAEFRAGGEKHGRKRIAWLMRAAGLIGASRRRGTIVTARRDKEARPAPDLVDRDFTAFRPNQLWVADITFVLTASGFLYLAVVLDAWSRKVVGWSMANHLRTELVLDALEMAIGQRRPDGVIHHSDCQYTSLAFGKRCNDAGVRPSMGIGRRRLRQCDVRELLRRSRATGPSRVGERVRGSPEPDLRLEEAAAGWSDERFRRRRRSRGGYGQRSAG
jgi:putative transposase